MFGTSGIRGPVGEEMTAALALSVGRAVASEGYDRVVVGRDARESGAVLTDALIAGVRECGGDVLEAGIVPTPTVARAVQRTDADAGLIVTASHNPASDNGIKLRAASGTAFDLEQRKAIATRVETDEYDLRPGTDRARSNRFRTRSSDMRRRWPSPCRSTIHRASSSISETGPGGSPPAYSRISAVTS